MAFTPLNALNAFVAVARCLSYAAAAKDLGVSTSALSQSVRQLEERAHAVQPVTAVQSRPGG
jgi:DNA-binding transcriptional LysR family regulator